MWMGFFGDDMFKPRGDPTKLFMKLEIPLLFFLHRGLLALEEPAESSDSLFNGVEPPSELVGVN
jgi:hypothetical protein